MGWHILWRKIMTKKIIFFVVFASSFADVTANEPLQPYLDSFETTEIAEPEPVLQKIDMPYTENPLIDHFRQEYLTDFGKKKLVNILQKAIPYRAHIQATLQADGVPLCIEFLPVIESEFTILAVSKSGATGIWQFMENSIASLLDKDEWIDERFDPWLSTHAAAYKLAYNYSVLKDWELALAAYNMGLNGLKSVMKKAGSDDFWYLAENGYLKEETKYYVPKFIAIADLITNADYYGIDIAPFDKNNDLNFEEITIANQINVKILSDALEIPYQTMKQLNPALKTEYTPPYSYTLRVPIGYTEKTFAEIKNQQVTKPYTVKKGDTLWGIAMANNITVQEICTINNIDQNDILGIGKVLFLPILK